MKTEDRIIAVQEMTQDYFRTSELLDLSYEEVCEEEE